MMKKRGRYVIFNWSVALANEISVYQVQDEREESFKVVALTIVSWSSTTSSYYIHIILCRCENRWFMHLYIYMYIICIHARFCFFEAFVSYNHTLRASTNVYTYMYKHQFFYGLLLYTCSVCKRVSVGFFNAYVLKSFGCWKEPTSNSLRSSLCMYLTKIKNVGWELLMKFK